MVEIECLVCGKIIEIPEFIDTDDYDGQLACRECASLLHVRLVGAKVRQYQVVEKGFRSPTADDLSDDELAAIVKGRGEPELREPTREEANIANIAKYNPLRDYLISYRAAQLQLAFEQIEGIIGCELEIGASTLKSWWDNDSHYPQAFAWLEAGWQVYEVNLPQRTVIFRREPER